jgi:predicted transcriptional regulator
MSTNISISKTYASEVISDYAEIVEKVDAIIKQTGYKGKFIAKKLGLPESSFYQKKREKTFTVKEMQQLVNLMNKEEDDDDDAIELAYFAPILKERENEIPIPLEDFISQYYAEKQ